MTIAAIETAVATAPVLQLVYREGLGSVFEAMVLTPWMRMSAMGVETDLLNFTPVGELVRSKPRQRWNQRISSIDPQHIKRFHRLVSPPARARQLWSDYGTLQRWMGRRFNRTDAVLLHSRGPHAADLAIRVRTHWPRAKVIFDMRGLVHAERLYETGVDDPYLAELENRAAREADAVICVSNTMANYASRTYEIDSDDITVIPCCVDTAGPDPRRHWHPIRERLGLAGRFVVAYCGGSQRWQLPLESAELFREIRKHRPDAHYLALVSDPVKLNEILDQARMPASLRTVLSVPHNEVAHYLAAADVGLLLREQHLINSVASPVKFGQFLASSLPVIISPGVGDFSELVEEEGVGLVLNEQTNLAGWLDMLAKHESEIRSRCRHVARTWLSMDLQVDELMSLYARLT